MKTVVVDGQSYRIDDEDPRVFLDGGGEADVYWFTPSSEFLRRHGDNRYIVKIIRPATTKAQQRAARERQEKLPGFPPGKLHNVAVPVAIAYDTAQQVIGYVMVLVPDGVQLIKFKNRNFREKRSITFGHIMRIFTNLHDRVSALHARGIVIGDFNDKNVLVTPDLNVWLIDADSFQYGKWACPTFTEAFVDPNIIAPHPTRANALKKIGPHSRDTDWYAFAVMLFQLLVGVHPYTAGFYRPEPGERPLSEINRIHKRISVFHPRVTPPPGVATPFDSLPDTIVQCFRAIFEQGQRGIIPRQLLNDAATTQSAPGTATPPPQPKPQSTSRTILAVALQGGRPQYVTYESGAYRREGGQVIWATARDPRITAIPAGSRTVMASGETFVVFDGARHSATTKTQVTFGRTTVAANSRYLYWLRGSELVRDVGHGGIVTIGKIAANSTSVWVGERFGLTLVQAGIFSKVLTFTERVGSFHSLTLPPGFGSVIDAQCVVGDDLAWLTLSTQSGGRVVNRCFVIDAGAQQRATAEATQDDGTWLGSFTPAAHAAGSKLIVPVPRTGIVRVGIMGEQARQELTYPGSSALVPNKDTSVGLTYSSAGILHVSNTAITPVATTL